MRSTWCVRSGGKREAAKSTWRGGTSSYETDSYIGAALWSDKLELESKLRRVRGSDRSLGYYSAHQAMECHPCYFPNTGSLRQVLCKVLYEFLLSVNIILRSPRANNVSTVLEMTFVVVLCGLPPFCLLPKHTGRLMLLLLFQPSVCTFQVVSFKIGQLQNEQLEIAA